MDAKTEVFCSILVDKRGNVLDVLDARNQSVRKYPTGDGITEKPGKVGQATPNGKKVKKLVCIEVVTTEEDKDDPCWIHDRFCNWWCLCNC